MIARNQYRGCFKDGITEESLKGALLKAQEKIKEMISDNKLLAVYLYRYRQMCFLYYEALEKGICPEGFLAELAPLMESWPEEKGKTPWAPMYHIYHHCLPEEPESWEKERGGDKTKIGRIAFLYPDKLFSYTYWHKAIVDEGKLPGDKYQCISLHENILFSYYEEPRTNVNLCGDREAESEAIKGWMAANPESHFDREKAGGDNFRVIEPILLIDRRTCGGIC
ncbi:MAG: hypothetical protein NC400_03450 [Clostridium sp.]|nr:hypothetical protein [Clostridium sp.]